MHTGRNMRLTLILCGFAGGLRDFQGSHEAVYETVALPLSYIGAITEVGT